MSSLKPFLVALLLCVCIVNSCDGEVFSASSSLEELFGIEVKIADLLEEYLQKIRTKLNRIDRYIEQYRQVEQEKADTSQKFIERVAGNPIHAFHIIKRFIIDWKHIERELEEDDWGHTARKITRLRRSAKLPIENDMHGAAIALVRLQVVYNLETSDLAKGIFLGIQTAAELTAQDCLYMGKHSFNSGLYSRAIEWFEEAHHRAGLENNKTLTQDQAMEFWEHALNVHDQMLNAKKEFEGVEYEYTMSARVKKSSDQRKEQMQSRVYKLGLNITTLESSRNYHALCRGEKLMSPKIEAKLKCWYETKMDKYWILHPIKMEQNYLSPPIFTLHDVIRDRTIQNIKTMSLPLLARGMVQSDDGNSRQKSDTRTCKTAWLADASAPSIRHNSEHISLLTGLKTVSDLESGMSSEPLQVANYGMGGHYEPHYDSIMFNKPQEVLNKMERGEVKAGDRIATFMYYLTDVEKGGATVFPRIGVAVTPEKGSAAFWYNLKEDGTFDELTIHGACPVVRGHKWVANKWIRETAQWSRRKCVPKIKS